MDKWEIEGKINEGYKKNPATCWKLLEEHITSKSNMLLAVVELKRLFQGNMNLEDCKIKAVKCIKQTEYPEPSTDCILRDTTISGIFSNKVRAKIVKEGKDVTLEYIVEISSLEVPCQKCLPCIQSF